jgi:hypothetical protein
LAAAPSSTAEEPPYVVWVGDVSGVEGWWFSLGMHVPITLDRPVTDATSLAVRTVHGTTDYFDHGGYGYTTVRFEPGEVHSTIELSTGNDHVREGPETFTLEVLATTANRDFVIGDGVGLVTVDDPRRGFSVGDATVYEPDSGEYETCLPLHVNGNWPRGWRKQNLPYTWTAVPTSGSGEVMTGSGVVPYSHMDTCVGAMRVSGDDTPELAVEYEVTFVGPWRATDSVGRLTILDQD